MVIGLVCLPRTGTKVIQLQEVCLDALTSQSKTPQVSSPARTNMGWFRGGSVQHQRRFNRVKRSQLANHVLLYFVWESSVAAVPRLFRYKSILILFFAMSNISSSTVPFMSDIRAGVRGGTTGGPSPVVGIGLGGTGGTEYWSLGGR